MRGTERVYKEVYFHELIVLYGVIRLNTRIYELGSCETFASLMKSIRMTTSVEDVFICHVIGQFCTRTVLCLMSSSQEYNH
jgi:hypothetical protein